ncbi:MAG: Ldh family oxidoreductase [Hyphomicrobiales bacterium]|nr:Ldh family oxidoreductase [Hyphomicrobiales bacterium]
MRTTADAHYIGLAMTNVTPNLVVPGGSRPITGNNPIAFAAPTRLGFPLLLDISMSAVAGGKLLLAMEKGEKIPLDWATDRNGRPTDDPELGFNGFLLPVGGHKGFGLSVMVDILCGVLTGGAFQNDIKSMYKHPDDPSETSNMMIAIDPAIAMEPDAFLDRMDALYRTIKASPMWDEDNNMYIPGEIENNTRRRRLEDGIPLPGSLYDEILALSARHDSQPPSRLP